MSNANLYFKFVDTTSKAGKTGLTVTANVYKLTKSGTKTTVATGASCAEVGGGIYSYNLSSPDFATYDYVATATPSDTTGLANADSDSMQADFSPDIQSRVTATRAGYLDNLSGGPVMLASAFSTLTAADVRAAIGMSGANLDTQLDALPKIQAAVYDTLSISGSVITMSDSHTQTVSGSGRVTE